MFVFACVTFGSAVRYTFAIYMKTFLAVVRMRYLCLHVWFFGVQSDIHAQCPEFFVFFFSFFFIREAGKGEWKLS